MEENPDREDIKVWRDYTIKGAIIIEKVMKAIKPQTINCCQRKLCPDVANNFTGFMTETMKEIMQRYCRYGKKKKVCVCLEWGGKSSQSMDLRESQEIVDTTQGELTDLMVINASYPVSEDEEEDIEKQSQKST